MRFDCTVLISIVILTNLVKTHSKSSSHFKRRILSNNDTDLYSVATATIKILKHCYGHALDEVIFAGDWVDFLSWKSLLSQISIRRIGSRESKVFMQHKRLRGYYKISEIVVKNLRYPAEVIIASTMHEPLKDTFKMLRKSKFWNSEATFFLIDENPKNQCLNFSRSFQVAWHYNVLHAIYVCYSANGNMYFYNFNPFMDYAPKPWEKVDLFLSKEQNHTTTIYRVLARDISSENSYCKLLFFDKTIMIDNYPIKLCGVFQHLKLMNISNSSSYAIKTVNDYTGIDSAIARIIWNKLRTSPTVKTFQTGGYVFNNIPHGLIKRIINRDFDMIMNEFFYRSFWRLETYPHGVLKLCALTRKQLLTPNVNSMLWMFQPKVITAVIPTSLLVAVVLKYLLRIGFVNACLEVLRLLSGVPMNQPIISSINNLNVALLIILMYALNLFLSGSLTSFFVAPKDKYNIDSMEDVVKYKYQVAGRPFIKELLVEDNFTEVNTESYSDNCVKKLEMDDKVACIEDCLSAIFFERKYDFVYLSKKSVTDIYLSFLFREDWPLRVRFNRIVQRLNEAGILEFIKNIEAFKAYPQRDKYRKEDTVTPDVVNYQGHVPLNLKAMTFAWYILAAGMVLSFAIFMFEYYMIKRNTNV